MTSSSLKYILYNICTNLAAFLIGPWEMKSSQCIPTSISKQYVVLFPTISKSLCHDDAFHNSNRQFIWFVIPGNALQCILLWYDCSSNTVCRFVETHLNYNFDLLNKRMLAKSIHVCTLQIGDYYCFSCSFCGGMEKCKW